MFPKVVTPNPSALGRGEMVAVIFQNPLLNVDGTSNEAQIWFGNSTNQIWLLLPGQDCPIYYAEDLKDVYVKLLFPFPNPNGIILTVGVADGGEGYTTGNVLTLDSPGGNNATVSVTTARGAATLAVLGVGGALYTVGDVLTLTGTGGTQITVDTVDGGGAILTFTISAPGTLATLGVKNTTGGTGAGATINITRVVGEILSVTLVTGGTLFAVNEIYPVTGGSGIDATIQVLTVEDTVPGSCNLTCLMYRKRKGGKQ
jgi:hypothetical protein